MEREGIFCGFNAFDRHRSIGVLRTFVNRINPLHALLSPAGAEHKLPPLELAGLLEAVLDVVAQGKRRARQHSIPRRCCALRKG